jgi:hypothetical protein
MNVMCTKTTFDYFLVYVIGITISGLCICGPSIYNINNHAHHHANFKTRFKNAFFFVSFSFGFKETIILHENGQSKNLLLGFRAESEFCLIL